MARTRIGLLDLSSLVKLTQLLFPTTPPFRESFVFSIVDSHVTTLSKIFVQQATGSGDSKDADENELDVFSYATIAKNGSFDLYVTSLFGPVQGFYGIQYFIAGDDS